MRIIWQITGLNAIISGMIGISTLGTIDLLDRTDGRQILSVLAQPKRLGVLAYLAMASSNGAHQRDTLLGIFWPDSTEKRARNALNQTVFVLRRALGQDLFTTNGDNGIRINREHLWCDVWAFEEALKEGKKEDALELYRGNFLNGFFLPGCVEFERWAESQRGQLRELATGAVLSLSHEMHSAGNPVGALGWVRRARGWAPYDEQILGRQIELQLTLGDRAGAVREFEAFARRLSTDLGLEPSNQTREILEKPRPVAEEWPRSRLGPDPEGQADGEGSFHGSPHRAGGRRFSAPQVASIAAVAMLMGVGGVLGLSRTDLLKGGEADPPARLPGEPRTVAVLPLENATGDPTLDLLGSSASDEILRELAARGVATVGSSVGPSGGREEPNQTTESTSPDAAGPPTLREADYLVTGTIVDREGQLAYQTRILQAEAGTIAVIVDSVMGPPGDPLEAVDRLKKRVAGALAMVLDPELSHFIGLTSLPSSFQAYQSFSDGLGNLEQGRAIAGDRVASQARLATARTGFLDAAASDSRFTLPLVMALPILTTQRDSVLGILRPRREDLPRGERAMLDFHEALEAGDFPRAYGAAKRVVEIMPTAEWRYQSAVTAVQTNRPREALESLRGLQSEGSWHSDRPDFWMWLVDAEVLVGDLQAARRDLRTALELHNDQPRLLSQEVLVLAGLGLGEEAIARAVEIVESTGQLSTHFLRYHLPKVLIVSGIDEGARVVAEASLETFSRIDGVRPDYVAATYVAVGRFEEARDLLSDLSGLRPGFRMEAYTLLAFMAAREGRAEEALRYGEMAATVHEPQGLGRGPYGVMAKAQAAAHLGDNAGAVRFLREAYQLGLPHGSYIFTRWDLRPLQGYQPFEDMMRPKG
ncbi:MAG: tetratricopeptide repeat protein [Gemmatimonadetes bacterium]|nr:tetratricopeptide repeat protein [Gemmatimonadota bacterium]NNM05557.1 tetratricopeptide repeat protein [Gemmatimonadota bacterium]